MCWINDLFITKYYVVIFQISSELWVITQCRTRTGHCSKMFNTAISTNALTWIPVPEIYFFQCQIQNCIIRAWYKHAVCSKIFICPWPVVLFVHYWCTSHSFGEISHRDVCLLTNIKGLNHTQLVVLKTPKHTFEKFKTSVSCQK